MKITKRPFGTRETGENVTIYTLTNQRGSSVSVCDLGGTVLSICVPDRNECLCDVVLGYHDLSSFAEDTTYFGALVGRCANRIARGLFTLGGQEYRLALNNPPNHLHGGVVGFSHRIWQVEELTQELRLSLHSPDEEEGYPGNLDVTVGYSFDDNNQLTIRYQAVSDKNTVCNLTNHAYFNLNGHDSGTIYDHNLKINADAYTPVDENLIPTGECRAVAGTPFDFRACKRIGKEIEKKDRQLTLAGGYDHNYVLRHPKGGCEVAAQVYSEASGIWLTCRTDAPGMQLYTGNFIPDRGPVGKGGAIYQARHGFCLETQNFPDAVHHKNFPSPVIQPGEPYRTVTSYQFGYKER